MKNIFRVVLAALLIGGVASAQESWPDLSGQTVRVAGVWSGDEQAAFTTVLNEFASLTGANVEFFSTGNDIATVVGTQLEGGSPPDVAMLPQPGLLVEFANRGALVSIEDSVGDLVDEYYADSWRDLGSVDGELYGVWFKAANKSLLWYNADILEAAGVEPPTTWEEFVEAAQTVYDSGVTPVAVAGGDGWTLTDWFENVYLRSAGPEMYDQLTNHEISWTDESVKQALEYLAQIWQHEWLANGLQGTLEAGFPVATVQPFLDNPTAAFAYGADFSAGVIEADTNAELGTTARFVPFPSVAGSGPAVVGGGDVAVLFTENPAAVELMRYLATPEAAEVWAALGGYTSPNQGVDVSVYPDEVLQQSATALQEAEVFRFDMSDLQPAAFGGTSGQGMWGLLVEFLQSHDVDGVAFQLESEASQAFQ